MRAHSRSAVVLALQRSKDVSLSRDKAGVALGAWHEQGSGRGRQAAPNANFGHQPEERGVPRVGGVVEVQEAGGGSEREPSSEQLLEWFQEGCSLPPGRHGRDAHLALWPSTDE